MDWCVISQLMVCCTLLALASGFGAGDDGAAPSSRELGYRLDPRFRFHSQGTAAGSLVELEDGRLMSLSSENGGTVRVSEDEGNTWTQIATVYEGEGPGKPTRDVECGLAIRTESGVIIWVYRDFENWHWQWDEETGEAIDPRLTVWSVRSLDGGKTWVDRQMIFDGYCGALIDIIQTAEGSVVVPVQRYVANPGRHCQCTYMTQDDGETWTRSNIIDLGGHGHHDGAFEGTLTELEHGRLIMLLRTGLDRFWRAYSFDGGRTWRQIQPTDIPASNAPGSVLRLQSGRLALVWNPLSPGTEMRPLMDLRPSGPRQSWGTELPCDGWRNSLLIAFSDDSGETWSEPSTFARGARLCYPQMWERRPGELWISFVAGKDWTRNLVSVKEEDLLKPLAPPAGEPLTIVAFGASTTAPRGSLIVYAMLLEWELTDEGRNVRVINAGKGSDNTVTARKRFEQDVLAHDPELVIIQLGINDSAIDVWRGVTEPRVPIADYDRNLEHLVTTLKDAGSKVILMTPNPLCWTDKLKELYGKPPYDPDDPDGFNFLLKEYAERCRQIAARQGVPLADSFRAFQEYGEVEGQAVEDLLLDGMHPNDLGHEIEADLLLEHIRAMFERPVP